MAFNNYYSGLFGGFLFRWVDLVKVDIINKELSKLNDFPKVLDLGCGTASISAKFIDRADVWGADSNTILLSEAKKRGVKVKLIDFDKPLPFKSDFFEVVLMIDSIEHVKSRESTIKEVKRILKKDGLLIVFTPPYDSISWLIMEPISNALARKVSDHISPFTRESLDFLLKSNFKKSKTENWLNFGLTMCGVARYKY